jgi:hypothetical protein
MNTYSNIVSQIEIPASALPVWEQIPLECRSDLIQALAALLLHLPQLQAIEQRLTTPAATAPGTNHEQRE